MKAIITSSKLELATPRADLGESSWNRHHVLPPVNLLTQTNSTIACSSPAKRACAIGYTATKRLQMSWAGNRLQRRRLGSHQTADRNHNVRLIHRSETGG